MKKMFIGVVSMLLLAGVFSGCGEKPRLENDNLVTEITVNPIAVNPITVETIQTENVITETILWENVEIQSWD